MIKNWVDFDEAVQNSKKKENYNYLFLYNNRRSGGLFPPSSGFWKVIGFPSLRNSEEGGNKPPEGWTAT